LPCFGRSLMSSLGLVVEGLSDLQKTRFVSAVGLVILLYDHLLCLPDEVRFIWSARITSSKILFLGMRYIVPWVMILHTVQLSGLADVHLSDDFCQVWYAAGMVLGWVTLGINDWLVLLRLWILWDRNRKFILSTLLVFLVSNAAVFILTVIMLTKMLPGMHFEPVIHLCSADSLSNIHIFRFLWLPGLIFQFVMVLSMAWKVFTCPDALKILIRDGYLYFLFLFAINLVNAMIVLNARVSLITLTIFFMWCFTTTATCRMILSLRRSSSADRAKSSDERHEAEDPHGGYQPAAHLELAWLRQQSMSTSRDPTPTPRHSTF